MQVQVTWRRKRQISPPSAYVYQRTPILGCIVVAMRRIGENFENFEKNVIREGSGCDLLVKLAYNPPILKKSDC